MRKIFTSIDIGTDSIKIACMEYFNKKYNCLASVVTPSSGVKQGLIINAEKVSNAIKKGIKEIESKLGTKITKVLAIVPSNNVTFDIVESNNDIKTENNIIDGDTIFNCLQKSLKNNVKHDMEVVSIMPIEYKLDNGKIVKNPLNMQSKTLSVKAVASSVPKKNVYSVVGIIENLGIEVIDISFSSIGCYYSMKTPDLDNKVVALIDIGSEITKLSVFNKGIMIKEKILLMGGNNIDNDISFNYKTDLKVSKQIKETFAVANRKYADSDEVYSCIDRNGQKQEINQYSLSEIIEARCVEMLKNAKNELNNLTNREIGYIIISGGITSMLGFDAIVEELFVRTSTVINIGVVGIRDNKYAASYGTIKYFNEKLNLRDKEYTMLNEEQVEEMLSTRKKVSSLGVLSKIFKIFEGDDK
ncbi:MAG: cell division FtsA domain-containing protein [Candidatus Aphodocola sp.]